MSAPHCFKAARGLPHVCLRGNQMYTYSPAVKRDKTASRGWRYATPGPSAARAATVAAALVGAAMLPVSLTMTAILLQKHTGLGGARVAESCACRRHLHCTVGRWWRWRHWSATTRGPQDGSCFCIREMRGWECYATLQHADLSQLLACLGLRRLAKQPASHHLACERCRGRWLREQQQAHILPDLAIICRLSMPCLFAHPWFFPTTPFHKAAFINCLSSTLHRLPLTSCVEKAQRYHSPENHTRDALLRTQIKSKRRGRACSTQAGPFQPAL